MRQQLDQSNMGSNEIYVAQGDCVWGSIVVAQSDQGICGITLGDDTTVLMNELQTKFPTTTLISRSKDNDKILAQVIEFVEKPFGRFDLSLDIRGTPFQQKVWQALQTIQSGHTISYSELAQRIGAPKAVRAVASACAANLLAIVIPCHRVVRSNGELSGYRWGVERKRRLLDIERLQMNTI